MRRFFIFDTFDDSGTGVALIKDVQKKKTLVYTLTNPAAMYKGHMQVRFHVAVEMALGP